MSNESDLLNKALQDNIKSSNTVDATQKPKFERGMQIIKVADYSPAKELGISVGDVLLDVNGNAASSKDMWDWLSKSIHHKYTFYLTKQNKLLHIDSAGIPLGLEFKKTKEAILKQYSSFRGDPEDLAELWARGEDDAIIDLVSAWENKGILKWERMLPRFLGEMFLLHEIEILFVAVALYEQDRCDEAIDYFERYFNEYMDNWTTQYHGIVYYYMALNSKRVDASDDAKDYIEAAYEYSDVDRIKGKCMVLEGKIPEKDTKEGELFPVRYSLPLKNNPNLNHMLNDFLEGTKDNQYFIICSLGVYRSNGPYDDFMKRFLVLMRHFPKLFSGMHVITSGDENPHWLENENTAKQRKLPFAILFDEDDELAMGLESYFSPYIVLLNNQGVIVKSSRFESEVEVWDMVRDWQAMEAKIG